MSSSSVLSLTSQGVVFATAMVVSTTVLFLAFSKQRTSPSNQDLRSCLSSSSEGKGRKKKKKKKRVRFAEDVKDTKGNGDEYRREKSIARINGGCRNQMEEIPANRIALYNGILRDRLHRMECSY